MRAKFINEIKKNGENNLSKVGIGVAGFLKAFYYLKSINKDFKVSENEVLSTHLRNFKTRLSNNDSIFDPNDADIMKNEIEKFTDCSTDNLAFVSFSNVAEIKNKYADALKTVPHRHNNHNPIKFPNDVWNYQIIYNNDLKFGYVEMYPKNKDTMKNIGYFIYFVRFK